MSTEYTLVGILNVFDSIPDFVYPVFEKAGKYYTQNKKDNFSFITLQSSKNNEIIFLDSIDSNEPLKSTFLIKAPPMLGFQLSENCVYLGTLETIKDYLKGFRTSNMILRMEIEDFLQNNILP